MMKPLLTVKDIAKVAKVKEKAVRNWLNNNKLRGFKMENQWRVAQPDWERFVRQNSNMAAAR
jgi:hypothetical protein